MFSSYGLMQTQLILWYKMHLWLRFLSHEYASTTVLHSLISCNLYWLLFDRCHSIISLDNHHKYLDINNTRWSNQQIQHVEYSYLPSIYGNDSYLVTLSSFSLEFEYMFLPQVCLWCYYGELYIVETKQPLDRKVVQHRRNNSSGYLHLKDKGHLCEWGKEFMFS